MPELPEVETVCRGLSENILELNVSSVEVYAEKLRDFIPADLNKKILNHTITKIERKAKYILIYLTPNVNFQSQVLIIHLGMSGRLTIQDEVYERKKHDHVILKLNSVLLVFNDARRFGIFTLTDLENLSQHKLFRKLGLEPLSKEFTVAKLKALFKNRNKNIKNTLMDASLIVGIGNIYASEALFRSAIHPERMASSLTDKDIKKLHEQIIITLEDAIRAGGSTLKDFSKANGESGYFQYQFKVYGREGLPCFTCKTLIQRIVQGGRSSFFCSKCQK
ncbi:MAG: bifunctional DNA-formamidopyrimidine glycosylase/DNA-(apurinic or apyrimidinic site) lyase [Proteobacteria bacterium]|nr:bifunctional DNA-formamidopyrimidine glycosylase/DNA-(apurinic or apyrimidinic site) lyase [Pseudomonadota bacterium]